MTQPTSSRRAESWILAATGVMALLPYFAYHRLFQQMYWFGDEFDLIDQIDRLGFWRWVWLAFAENFVPLFKVLWGGAVLVSGGNYACMIALVWLTHAVNVALLGRVMRTCGLTWVAVFIAQVIFGLSVENYETLAWSVQWSALLSVTFMLLGLDSVFASGSIGLPLGYSFASGLSFSRGALTGPILGAARYICDRNSAPFRRAALAAVFLLPAVCVAALIFALAKGNQHTIGSHLPEAFAYALWYFCLNPLYSLFLVESWGWRTTLILGAVKVAVIAYVLMRAQGPARRLFITFLLFDLANAGLLGVGRYHTGIVTTVSSRYQYASMLAFLPMAGFWLSRQIERTGLPKAVLATAAVGFAVALCLQWPSELDHFAEWRGSRSRRILFVDANPGVADVPGIPTLPMERAKELIRKYNLH